MEYKITFKQYQQGLEQGKFLGLTCRGCGRVIFPPQAVCRGCGSSDLSPMELGGEGTLKTFTVVRVAPEGKKPPYIVAMAELDEGPWAMGNLVGIDPASANMGLMGRRIFLGSQPVQGDPRPGEYVRVLTFTLKEA